MIAHWFEIPYCGPLIHRNHAYAAYLEDACATADQELAARRAVVAQANAGACCPTCGQTLPTPPTPAYDASGDRGVVPPKKVNESWRDREPLL